ncbi:MAG TPA: xanthine dehydrogenase family protein molybdopterin-binding subunit [Chloroflexota bacterium]|nr:xanthine dehydrogenase family protein molybdopterin-binding subunit [Chloroflexota bacterium]
MAGRIDVFRVATDPAYAARLTSSDWATLRTDPELQMMIAEQYELVATLLEKHGERLGYAPAAPVRQGAPAPQPAPPVQPPQPQQFKIIGKKIPRLHGLGIVTALGRYTEHLSMEGMLYTRTLRSPHPHAKVTGLNTQRAEQLAGVKAILHRGTLPAEYRDVKLGAGPPDRFLFNEEVFEVGSPIAVVAADSEHIADEAIRLIEVQYEILPATLDMMEGAKAGAAKQWNNNLDGTIINVTPPLVRGDPDGARADTTIEAVLLRGTEQHMALELTSSLSYWDTDKLVMTYTNQYAHGSRSGLSQALKIPQNKVRVIQPGYMGSGYGYRGGIDLSEVHSAILAKMTGRPIKTIYTRTEDFVTRTHRPNFRNEMKLGVNRDGTLQSGRFKVYANVGAQRAGAANGAWFHMQNTYAIPNLKLEAVDVFTNSYKSGPYRCVSHPNGTFALEMMIERAAYAIGMDPVEFRLKNLNEKGNPDTNRPFSNPGLRDCITQAADTIGWKQKWHAPRAKEVRPGVFHGIGLAAHGCSHGGGGNPISGQVIVNVDGSVQAVSASNEVGDGQRTLAAMVAAESLGVPLERVTITTHVDTDFTSDTGVTAGSIQTNTGAYAMYQAAQDARKQLLDWGARKMVDDAKKNNQTIEVKPDELDVIDAFVVMKSDANKKVPLNEVTQFRGAPIVGQYVGVQDQRWERTGWAAHAAEIEVDTVTGSVVVTQYAAAHDVGRALNPFALEQQIEGGVVMALGATFTEEMLIDTATGLPLNPNMLDYKPLSIKDAPKKIDVILVERTKDYGTYGAHGIGEPPMGPPAAAVAAAVYNATGAWIDSMPMTREKLLAALRSVR